MEIGKSEISGVYLVIDPSADRSTLPGKVWQALEGGVSLLQIWNHWPDSINQSGKKELITSIQNMAAGFEVPVLINQEWELLKSTRLDGVHFEEVPDDYPQIQQEVGRDFIAGITCSNDLKIVRWAEEYELDYISFCAMFPSPSVSSCEIVRPETVRRARQITGLPLFLSGGITPGNLGRLGELDFNGVAVISGILDAEDPLRTAKAYKQALKE